MKKWALRIALSLLVPAAPAVAQFAGPSVQGDPPSHDRVANYFAHAGYARS
jgi:hypothetical protein